MPKWSEHDARMAKRFGDRLRSCRKAAGYETADEFARKIDLPAATYRAYERGSAIPRLSVLFKIHGKLGKTLDFLLLGISDNSK